MDIIAGFSESIWERRQVSTDTVPEQAERRMKNKYNTLFFKIIMVVLGAILCLTAALSVLNIDASQDVFVENFLESQKKIFRQIDENIYEFFQDAASTTAGISGSAAVREYLTREQWENAEEARNILDMKKVLQQQPFSRYSDMSMILIGNKGKTYNYNSNAKLIFSGEELLKTKIIRQAFETPRQLICQYEKSGYTDVMKDYPVIMMAKAITRDGGKTAEGAVLLTIKEADFRKYYDVFTTSINDILIFNQENQIISSNQGDYLTDSSKTDKALEVLGDMQEEKTAMITTLENGNQTVFLMQRFQNTNYRAMGVIYPDQAFENVYDFRYIIGVTAVITVAAILIIFILVRQQTRPLSNLVENMRKVQDGQLDKLVRVEGTQEVRELSATYNEMLGELENYIEKLIQVESAKREAEIHSLQMQINPHYIYNTLASVKWLIWQGDKEKSVQVIDAFIQLLRNTISNKKEFITLKEEIENLKNYVLINQIRYGNQVNVEFYVTPDCEEQKIPKLILQPFVENSFFHGFPQGKQGTISIFARQSDRLLKVEIEDNGIGMNSQTLRGLLDKKNAPTEHFTGIGVNNVDDRMKLIYGENYGILVESQEGRGTKITVCFPLK